MADDATAALRMPAVAGITRLSAVDTVRARIALAVELGLLRPGEQLPPDADVAAALDVSEITVRRALVTLADDGLLHRKRGRRGGTFVADHSPETTVSAAQAFRADADTVHGLIDRRAALEIAVAHLAAESATAADLAELDAAVEAAATATDWADYHAADERFHLAVARAGGREWAMTPYRETLEQLYAYFLPYPIDYLHGVNAEHAELAQAIRERDVTRAAAIAERHVLVLHRTMFVGLDRPAVTP